LGTRRMLRLIKNLIANGWRWQRYNYKRLHPGESNGWRDVHTEIFVASFNFYNLLLSSRFVVVRVLDTWTARRGTQFRLASRPTVRRCCFLVFLFSHSLRFFLLVVALQLK
jgi:hypothetical protein